MTTMGCDGTSLLEAPVWEDRCRWEQGGGSREKQEWWSRLPRHVQFIRPNQRNISPRYVPSKISATGTQCTLAGVYHYLARWSVRPRARPLFRSLPTIMLRARHLLATYNIHVSFVVYSGSCTFVALGWTLFVIEIYSLFYYFGGIFSMFKEYVEVHIFDIVYYIFVYSIEYRNTFMRIYIRDVLNIVKK